MINLTKFNNIFRKRNLIHLEISELMLNINEEIHLYSTLEVSPLGEKLFITNTTVEGSDYMGEKRGLVYDHPCFKINDLGKITTGDYEVRKISQGWSVFFEVKKYEIPELIIKFAVDVKTSNANARKARLLKDNLDKYDFSEYDSVEKQNKLSDELYLRAGGDDVFQWNHLDSADYLDIILKKEGN